MDRLNPIHQSARVDLGVSVGLNDTGGSRPLLRPRMRYALSVIGCVCCSAMVIAAASLAALTVN